MEVRTIIVRKCHIGTVNILHDQVGFKTTFLTITTIITGQPTHKQNAHPLTMSYTY